MSMESRPKYPFPPLWLDERMLKEKSSEPWLITKNKRLSRTDLTLGQSRILFPKALGTDFLTDVEKAMLEEESVERKQGVSVIFVDPLWKKHEVDLKKLKNSLVLSKWGNVLTNYTKFKEGQMFSFWCFRSERKKLCFCLVPDQESYTGDFEDDFESNLEKEFESSKKKKKLVHDSSDMDEADDVGYLEDKEYTTRDSGDKDETDDYTTLPNIDYSLDETNDVVALFN